MSVAERAEYQREVREQLAADGVDVDEPACRGCGCSDSLGCPEGCWWVEAGLCSACAEELEAA